MNGISYKALTLDDTKGLSALHKTLFTKSLTAQDFTEYLVSNGNKESHAMGAFSGDDLVGFIVAQAIMGEAEILTLGVQKDCQKHGIGKKLIDMLKATTSIKTIFLEVNVNNIAAISLYQKAGFKEIARREKYYQTPSGGL